MSLIGSVPIRSLDGRDPPRRMCVALQPTSGRLLRDSAIAEPFRSEGTTRHLCYLSEGPRKCRQSERRKYGHFAGPGGTRVQARQQRFATRGLVDEILPKLGRAAASVPSLELEQERSSGRRAVSAHPFEKRCIWFVPRRHQVIRKPISPLLGQNDHPEPVRPKGLRKGIATQPPRAEETAAGIRRTVVVDRAAACTAKMARLADAHLVPTDRSGQPAIATRGARSAPTRLIRHKDEGRHSGTVGCRLVVVARDCRGGYGRQRRSSERDYGPATVLISLAASTVAGFVAGGIHLNCAGSHQISVSGYGRSRKPFQTMPIRSFRAEAHATREPVAVAPPRARRVPGLPMPSSLVPAPR